MERYMTELVEGFQKMRNRMIKVAVTLDYACREERVGDQMLEITDMLSLYSVTLGN